MRKRTRNILLSTPVVLAALLFTGYKVAVNVKGQDNVNVGIGLVKQRLGMEVSLENEEVGTITHKKFDGQINLDKSIKGFEEIGASLGHLAKGNNMMLLRGMATFDANGDGLQDIYFTHNGRPTMRPSDENNVLQMDKRVKAKPNTLYLNQGNDASGNPIYLSIQELIKSKTNKKYTKEELLIENKYEPRTSIDDDPYKEGRISFGVVTADFNGDKMIDILVLNNHYGTPFTVPGRGMRIYPGANHLGRSDKDNLDFIEALAPEFLVGDGKDGSQNTYRGEGEGMNTLFINKGDKDKDGIPEWENITAQAGLTTNYASASGTVADIDRDGDLDLFIGNFLDPDFWGFGMERFPGNPNTLFVNQLAETGELKFVESAEKYGVSGSCSTGIMDCSLPLPNGKSVKDPGVYKLNGRTIGHNTTHTWAAMLTDFNKDGFPDLIVTNDIPNRMEAYINVEGKRFEYIKELDDPKYIGCWMGVGIGDFNGDGEEEFFASNCGGGVYSIRNTSLMMEDRSELNQQALVQLNGLNNKSTLNHTVFQVQGNKINNLTEQIEVKFNPLTAPDVVLKNNVHPDAYELYDKYKFDKSIAGAEFSWCPSIFDIENDGDLDIYLVGALNRGNDNFIGDWSGGVGRLLENNSTDNNFSFSDKTYEYQLFNIDELDYSEIPAKKPAPGTGWHKENYVHFTDRDAYSGVGMEASQSSEVKDIFRMHEAAHLSIATDLNGDGNMDIVVPNGGGYSSVSKDARNLKVDLMGQAFAVPPPNKVLKAPTNFQEGETFVYINKNENDNNWVKIVLDNEASTNKFGIGAKLNINDKKVRTVVLGGRNLSMNHEALHVGLGTEVLKKITVIWPDGSMEAQEFNLKEDYNKKTIVLKRSTNEVEVIERKKRPVIASAALSK